MITETINDAICDRPEILWDDLGLEGEIINNHIDTYCPIHNGDNSHGLTIYFNEYRDIKGRWKCHTRSCQRTFKNTPIGFVRGVLSNRYCGWSKPGDKVYGWNDTLKYLKGLYGIEGEARINLEDKEKKDFIRSCGCNHTIDRKIICTKEKYLWYYFSPPQYFRERGFSSEVLEKYNVRYCDRPNSKLYRRCCVPIFDDVGRNVMGISARTTCDEEPKWYNTTNFPSSTSLYNYGYASEYIKRSRVAIIVESPGNIWRLSEAGIYNAVGIWGTELNDYKRYLLDKLGVMKLVLALDNDEAGEAGRAKIRQDSSRLYNIVDLSIPVEYNDVADMSINEVKKLFNKEM